MRATDNSQVKDRAMNHASKIRDELIHLEICWILLRITMLG